MCKVYGRSNLRGYDYTWSTSLSMIHWPNGDVAVMIGVQIPEL